MERTHHESSFRPSEARNQFPVAIHSRTMTMSVAPGPPLGNITSAKIRKLPAMGCSLTRSVQLRSVATLWPRAAGQVPEQASILQRTGRGNVDDRENLVLIEPRTALVALLDEAVSGDCTRS